MAEQALFYLFALISITSAGYTVIARRPSSGILSLVLTMFALAGLFTLLHAYFAAVIQILIYAGAILVLFLLMLMLMGIEAKEAGSPSTVLKRLAVLVIVSSFVVEAVIFLSGRSGQDQNLDIPYGTAEAIGQLLLTRYLVPFELISVVLLVGVVGVVYLTKRETR